MSMPSLDVQPVIHGITGTPFGDLEFDAGKSIRWLEHFVHTTFILDVNTGEQRYWVINWAESFPYAKYSISGINFFKQPVEWRKAQFEAGMKAWNYKDDDWVLFIDGHEGLSVDNRTLPNDYAIDMFKSWIWREIQRVLDEDPEADRAYLRFFAYQSYRDLQNVAYATSMDAGLQTLGLPPVQQAISVPRYHFANWLPRLLKVSALKDPTFNWSDLDLPIMITGVGTPDAKVQLITYAYAHWNVQDIPPGQTTVPPLSEENDDGWRMRKLISQVRPLLSMQAGPIWRPPEPPWEWPGDPGPWCVDSTTSVDPSLEGTVEEAGHAPPDIQTEMIRVPLYDTVMRLNLRDGLWYERGSSGNVPLSWDEVNQVWVPNYDPNEWPDKGVGALSEPPPTPSRLSLHLDGTSGTYARTFDSNELDFASSQSFTLWTLVSLDTWHPSSRQTLLSKWGDAGQRSWYWANEVGGGMVLVLSRDGTDSVEFPLDLGDGPALDLVDGATVLVGVTYYTNLALEDEVQFWLSTSPASLENPFGSINWMPVSAPITQPNPTSVGPFNSTAEVQVGAQQGTLTSAGYFRYVSISAGVGESQGATYPGGGEVARMRGDLPSNPTYDIYGNLWSNQGSGWSYEDLP